MIVTGSRDWPFEDTVHRALDGALEHAIECRRHLLVRVGDCWTGADRYAQRWVDRQIHDGKHVLGMIYKADWEGEEKAAGPNRNRRMVEAGADLVLAFQKDKSRGTESTIQLARKAGIPVNLISLSTDMALPGMEGDPFL